MIRPEVESLKLAARLTQAGLRVLWSDGVFGWRPTSHPARHEVLRFRLMVERGLYEAATNIREGSAA